MAIDTSTISGVMTTAQYKAQQAATPQKTSMGQSEFLTLFTTQLKNQDPTDPVKNEAFVAQLAQFSQLEASTAMRTSMDSLVSTLANDRLLGATSLIGKTVGVPDGPVEVTDTTVSQGTLLLLGNLVSPTSIASGATLQGIATISGNVINSGTIAPGTRGDIGTLTTWAPTISLCCQPKPLAGP